MRQINLEMYWKKSPAHLLLLSKFKPYREPIYFYTDEKWRAVLQENPQEAVNRFVRQGILEICGLDVRLSYKFKVSELKTYLLEEGLKVSGRKEELIERLIKANPEKMKHLVENLVLLQQTTEGNFIAEAYVEYEKARRKQAELNTLDALKLNDFREASQIVVNYEVSQVFSRGISVGSDGISGIDWTNHDSSHDLRILEIIFQSRPKILRDFSDENLSRYRILAGMLYLWGTNNLRINVLPEGYEGSKRFDNDTVSRMLLSFAYHKDRIDSYQGRVKSVKILTAGGHSCPECQKLEYSKYNLDQAPELPYSRCTHEAGCRCRIVVNEFIY